MSAPRETIDAATGDGAGSSRAFSGGTLLAVLAVNLLILAYSIWVTHPREHDAGGEVATVEGSAEPADQNAERNLADWLPPPDAYTRVDLPSPDVVRSAFVQHCAACHGGSGRGDGPAAEQLHPKPRDFVDSPFRFASTGGTRIEIVTALERTIAEGVPRSAMPGFHGVLSEVEIAGLARYVLELREEQGGATGEEASAGYGQRPPVTEELLSRGKQLYSTLACSTCHGVDGRGDGPAAPNLVDSIGRPVRPADFSTGLFKSGQAAGDIARTIARGVPGTPMTPFEPMLVRASEGGTRDATDLWALVSYVQGFTSRSREIGESSGAAIRVVRASDERMLDDPAHPGWLGVEYRLIALRPLWQRHEETDHAWVRCAKTDDAIAVCLEWRDDTFDVLRDHGTYPDAAAVMFALGEEVPALPMGVRVEGYEPDAPVNIWHWRGERQLDAATGRQQVLSQLAESARRAGTYVLTDGGNLPETTQPEMGVLLDAAAQAPESRAACVAGNPLADAALLEHSVLESNALGFGSLTLQPADRQHVHGTAAWSTGTWRVVMKRSLSTGDSDDVAIDGRRRLPIAFAVWNGAKGDRAGVKLVSGWHWIVTDGATGESR